MTHRAEQIVDALAALISAREGPDGVHVYTHRRLTLDPEQDEMPARSVDFGELEVIEETEDEIYFALACPVTAVVMLPTEPEAKTAVLAAAREIHRAIMASPAVGMPWRVTLGLAFVITVRPLGWTAPEYEVSGEQIVGTITTNWRIEFKTDVDDPGDG